MFTKPTLRDFILEYLPPAQLEQPGWFHLSQRADRLARRYEATTHVRGQELVAVAEDIMNRPNAKPIPVLSTLTLADKAGAMIESLDFGHAFRSIQYGADYMREIARQKSLETSLLPGLPRPSATMGKDELPVDDDNAYAEKVSTAADVGTALMHLMSFAANNPLIPTADDLETMNLQHDQMMNVLATVKLRDNFIFNVNAATNVISENIGGLTTKQLRDIEGWISMPYRPASLEFAHTEPKNSTPC